jgi:hypothetical protein
MLRTNLMALLYALCYPKRLARESLTSFMQRGLECTPFLGNYGPAGWLVCVNGSPPRGSLLLYDHWGTFYVGEGKSRRLTGRQQLATIAAFKKEHLKGDRPFKLG